MMTLLTPFLNIRVLHVHRRTTIRLTVCLVAQYEDYCLHGELHEEQEGENHN